MENLFGKASHKNNLVRPLSSVSRVVDENGEPQIKMYPELAYEYLDERIKDLILAVAIVHEDLLNDGFEVETFPRGILGNPLIKPTKDSETIYVVVRVSRYPNEIASLSMQEKELLLSNYFENLYEAKVNLMYVGDDTGQPNFVSIFRGLQEISNDVQELEQDNYS